MLLRFRPGRAVVAGFEPVGQAEISMLSSRLFWRVFGAYVAVSLVGAIVFIALVSHRLRDIVEGRLRQRLHDTAIVLRAGARPEFETGPSPALQKKLTRLGEQTEMRITLVAESGIVVGDSQHEPATMDNHRDRSEIAEARRKETGTAQRISPTLGIAMMYYAVRLGDKGQPIGFVRVALPMESVNAQVASVQTLVWGTAVGVNLVALAITFLLVGRIIRPLETLTRASQAVASGDLKQSVDIDRRDEIGALADAFNSMTEQLAHRIDQFRRNQNELEETTKLLQTVFGTMVEGVMAIDADQKILFANQAARSLLDLGSADVVGRPVWEVARSATIQESARIVLEEQPQDRREFPLPRTENIAALVASRLPGDPCPGAVLVLHDVTELRRLENLRREFVSNVSHELKTPLTAIQAYAETLQNGAIEEPEHNREFVRRIEEQADRLHMLILDLLAIARIESGEDAFEVGPIPIAKTIRTCCDAHQRVASSKGVAIRCIEPEDTTLRVLADEEGVRTIFDNLVDNAIDYTPAGGEVSLSWTVEGQTVRIDVTDTGVGIPHEHQKRIFERFYRVDKARSRELGGTGLGLAIVKHLTQVFGGRVEVDSEPGRGSTFSVYLPFATVFVVGVVLVAQAAFQPAAAAGDLVRVECGLLELGHLHRNGRHLGQVGVAADRFATVAVIGQQLGFVANADLPHLDTCAELLRERFDEISKVDPFLGQIVHDDAFAAEEMLDIDELHLQLVFGDHFPAAFEIGPFRLADFFVPAVVLFGGAAQNSPDTFFCAEILAGAIAGGKQHFTPFDAPVTADNDFAVPRVRVIAFDGELGDLPGAGFAIRGGILGDWGSQFGFTKTELGRITGGGLVGFGVTIIACSVFIDKIGYKPLMLLAFLLHVASAVVTLAATPIFDAYGKDATYQCLYWGMFMFALANGMCEAVINPLVATIFPNQKTHYLNILHAGWPGGLIVGGIVAYLFTGKEAAIAHLPWEVPMGFFLIPTLLYGFMILKEKFPVSEARAAGVDFATMLKEFASPMLLFLFLLHAMVGYVELGTDSWITNIMGNVIGGNAIFVIIYTSIIMFVLRFFAGPIVEKINPLGLLLVSAVLGCVGLYMLGSVSAGLAIFVAATVYGLGKTFFWPTMLGVVGERFPKGGALTMGTIGGIGMLSAGLLGGPGIGYKQDYSASEHLKEQSKETYERYAADETNSFLGVFPEVRGIDAAKVATLRDDGEDLAKRIENLESSGKKLSEDEKLSKFYEWWKSAKPYAEKDKEPIKEAEISGGQQALKWTAAVPATMALGYLLLVLYFRSKGGYAVEVLHGEEPVGEHYTGGVEGPIE
eukprot:g8239.t1